MVSSKVLAAAAAVSFAAVTPPPSAASPSTNILNSFYSRKPSNYVAAPMIAHRHSFEPSIASCETPARYSSMSIAAAVQQQSPESYRQASELPLPPKTTEPLKKKEISPAATEQLETFKCAQIPTSMNLRQSKVTLFQFESCPFCKRVRVCLDLLQIPYHIVEVDPLFKKEITFSKTYKKVPQLLIQPNRENDAPLPVAEENIMNDPESIILRDSKNIVHKLLEHEGVERKDEVAVHMEQEWLKWVDKWLVQVVVMNIYRSLSESSETFQYILSHPDFTFFKKRMGAYSGTFVMWLVSRQKKKNYSVSDEREALYNALNDFVTAVGDNKFIGGQTPNECDIAVYGILLSIKGFKAEKDVFENTKIGRWYTSMEKAVGKSEATNPIVN